MPSLPTNPDIVIIGAGAAGVAAARALQKANVSFLVIEARERPGGRALTLEAEGLPVDIGCGWFHSADCNPLVGEAEALGFEIDRSTPPWQMKAWPGNFPFPEQEAYRREWSSLYRRIGQAASDGDDAPAGVFLDRRGKFNAMLDAGSTFVNGVELAGLSIVDYSRYADTGVNWRTPAGLGALISSLAAALPISYDCAASRVDHSGARLKIETGKGAISARAVIITLPTNLLASEALAFTPALPDKTAAAAHLPLGLADKLFLTVGNAQYLAPEMRLYGARDKTAMASYHLRPFGRPLIEAYFGGSFAHELERGGSAAFADYAIEDIASALGSSMRHRLKFAASSAWARDPFAQGSYSHALPGYSGARALLAAPVNERLFFAGEATSKHDYSTAHGAWKTGGEAAQAALAALRI